MAFRLLLRPALRPFTFAPLAICATSVFAAPFLLHLRRPVLADSFSSSPPLQSYQRSSTASPLQSRRFNAKAVRQISAGSILGLFGGVALSFFSKPLALLIGLLIFGVQALESRGVHLIPYQRLQKYVKSVNLASLVTENVAFKLSFGATFALAALGQF